MSEEIIDLISGNISGWSAVLVGQPLDMIKTKLQLNTELTVHSVNKLFEAHGIRFFYKGASSVFLFVGLIVGSEFLIFEVVKKHIERTNLRKEAQLMLSGGVVGFFSSLIYTPMEYAKIHTQIGQSPNNMGSARMIFHVLWKERIRGLIRLYKGYPLSLMREAGGTSLYFGFFHILMVDVAKMTREEATLTAQLSCAFASSTLYHLYAYPIDCVKTAVQAGHSSIYEMLKQKFWKTRNFRAGYGVALFRGITMDTTNFTVYENVRRLLMPLVRHN